MQQVTLIGAAAWHISGKLSFERACSETSRMEGHVAEGQPVLESTEDSTRTLCVTAFHWMTIFTGKVGNLRIC